MKLILKIIGFTIFGFIAWFILIFSLVNTPEKNTSHLTPTPISQEWIIDASDRYFKNHNTLFNDLTPDTSKNIMTACIKVLEQEQRCEDIINQKFWIGMSSEWAIYSLGEPNDINTTVVGDLKREQWVYGDPIYGATYLYFDNGILSSYQN